MKRYSQKIELFDQFADEVQFELHAVEEADGQWVRYHDARAVIDALQAQLNERDAELDRLRPALEVLQDIQQCSLLRSSPPLSGRVDRIINPRHYA